MIVQRPLYSARNDDVHLRLRVKLTVIDHGNRQQQQADVDTKRKRRKSHHNSEDNAMDATTGDTEMLSSTQEIENKETQSTSEGANPSGVSLQASLASTAGDPSQSTTVTSATATTEESRHSGSKTTVTRQYQLCQYGHPEPGRTIVVRSAILVKLHGDAFGFLSLLGYG